MYDLRLLSIFKRMHCFKVQNFSIQLLISAGLGTTARKMSTIDIFCIATGGINFQKIARFHENVD